MRYGLLPLLLAIPLGAQRAPSHASRPFKVCTGGDVTLGTDLTPGWGEEARSKFRDLRGTDPTPDALLAQVSSAFSSADLILLNIEGAVAGPTHSRAGSKCAHNSENCYAFRSPYSSAAALRSLKADVPLVANLANNHAMDAGRSGRETTARVLGEAGLIVTGLDTMATVVTMATGDQVAVLGFHTGPDAPNARDLGLVHRAVERARRQWGIVIVTMHLGAEGAGATHTRDQTERFLGADRGNPVAFAHAAQDAGAALVLGHGPHVWRAMEWTEGGPLMVYSMGNLVNYGPFALHGPATEGGVLCIRMDTTGMPDEARLQSFRQRALGVVERDSSEETVRTVRDLGRADFPYTHAHLELDGRIYPRRPTP